MSSYFPYMTNFTYGGVDADPDLLEKAFRNNNFPEYIRINTFSFMVTEGEYYGNRPADLKHTICIITTNYAGIGGVGVATCSYLDEFDPVIGQSVAFVRAVRDAQANFEGR